MEISASGDMVNLPNMVTVFRIRSVPVFIHLLICDRFGYAFAVFFTAVVSDGPAGWITRISNRQSRSGMYLAPLADKVLLISAFMTLSILRHVPIGLTTIVSGLHYIWRGTQAIRTEPAVR